MKFNKDRMIHSLPIYIFIYSILIMGLKKITYDFGDLAWITSPKTVVDIFAYYKSRAIILAAVLVIIVLIYDYFKGELSFEFDKKKYLPFIIMAAFIFISYMMSEYKQVASIGFFDRYEGVWVSLSYIVMALYTTYVIKKGYLKINILIRAILILSFILGIIGTLQYFKIDIFRMPWFKKLLVEPVLGQNAGVKFRMPLGRVYLTLYNPNYVGVFITVMIAVGMNTLIFSANKINKFISLINLPLLLFSIIGSESRAGMIGIVFLIIVMIGLNYRKIMEKKNVSVVLIIILIAGIMVINIKTDGYLKQRFLTIFNFERIEYNGLQQIELRKNGMTFKYNDNEYKFIVSEKSPILLALKENNELILPEKLEEKGYMFPFGDIKNIRVAIGPYKESFFWQFIIHDYKWNFVLTDNGIRYLNGVKKISDIKNAQFFKPLEGYERVGSGRGYIWSRSIPLLDDVIVKGYGPDNYALYFPQDDIIYKLHSEIGMFRIVDKPHNMYLQYAINYGIIALMAFLVVVFNLFRKAFVKLKEDRYQASLVCTTMVAILVVMFFNDSSVTVSPMMWTIIGIGYSL